jgi:hypothetical protein
MKSESVSLGRGNGSPIQKSLKTLCESDFLGRGNGSPFQWRVSHKPQRLRCTCGNASEKVRLFALRVVERDELRQAAHFEIRNDR